MRSLLIVALLIAALAPLPGAAAKAFAEDPAGDPEMRTFGLGTGPAAGAAAEAADLLSLELKEDAEELTFVLAIQNLKQQASFAQYRIHFTWAKDEYAVVVQRSVLEGVLDDNSNAYLINEEESRWDAFAYLEHEIDLEAGLITVYLPKPYILSETGRYPLLGDDLSDVYVEAQSHVTIFQFAADAYDRMPDGDGSLKYPFQFGDLAAGQLRLDADERVRVSNGGATTFVYRALIQNTGDEDDQVDIILSELPEGWNGTVQSPLRVPGGSERRVAILVSVPFAHDHGGFSSFNVSVRSQEDPGSFAAIRMGVLHTPIPQPAGHHAELYLHAKSFNTGPIGQLFPFTEATMNTDGAHEGDAPEAAPNNQGDGLTWNIPLDPVMRMGLDFDIERLGEITGSLVGHGPSAGSLRAELLLTTIETSGDDEMPGMSGPTDGLLLGDTDEVDLTLDASNPVPFKLTLTPTAESDYIPYARGQNLMLVLYYEMEETTGNICCLPAATPGLVTEGFLLKLPLNEYHDKLNGFSEAADALDIKAEGPVEKAGFPGATMTYVFTLTNRGASSEIIDIDLAGTDAMLGTLVPSGAIELGAKESRTITLAVAIPTDKNDGEELEVLVFAHAQEDPSKSAIARTKTIVAKTGSGNAVADETGVLLAAQEAENNDTPASGVLLAFTALGAVAFMMRKRRG